MYTWRCYFLILQCFPKLTDRALWSILLRRSILEHYLHVIITDNFYNYKLIFIIFNYYMYMYLSAIRQLNSGWRGGWRFTVSLKCKEQIHDKIFWYCSGTNVLFCGLCGTGISFTGVSDISFIMCNYLNVALNENNYLTYLYWWNVVWFTRENTISNHWTLVTPSGSGPVRRDICF